MRILAIETSGTTGSVAVADGPKLLAESSLPGQRRSTQTLAPTIHSLLAAANWKPADLELIAVTIGPGSFTGLRLGVATAKMLAYVSGASVLGIDTLRTIAAQGDSNAAEITALLDAGRGELLLGHFRFDTAGLPLVVTETQLLPATEWLASMETEASAPGATPQHAASTLRLTGPGLRALANRLPAGAALEPEARWEPRAATVARLAWHDFSAGRRDDPWTLVPVYYRRSAAEEVWSKKHEPHP